MSVYVGYQGARTCTGTATPGARALMSWFLGAYAGQGAANLGIYVCKTLPGSTTTSLHGEGRAGDLGTTPYRKPSWGWTLANRLKAHSAALGIQCLIYDRHIWSGSYPHSGWRPYGGSNPHTGHVHTELSWAAATTLTVARIQQVLHTPPPAPPADWTGRTIMALPTLRQGAGMTGSPNPHVKTLQALLGARGNPAGGVDGRFGPATDRAVKAFQGARKISKDGIVGKITWHHLLNQQALL